MITKNDRNYYFNGCYKQQKRKSIYIQDSMLKGSFIDQFEKMEK